MERSSLREASEKENVFTYQPTAADPAPAEDSSSPGVDAGGASRRWHRRQTSSTPPPWRVEGLKPNDQDRSGKPQNWSRFLWLILGLLIVNWLLSSMFTGATSPVTISYSFFLTQVRSGNVQSVDLDRRLHSRDLQTRGRLPAQGGERPAGAAVHNPTPLVRK